VRERERERERESVCVSGCRCAGDVVSFGFRYLAGMGWLRLVGSLKL